MLGSKFLSSFCSQFFNELFVLLHIIQVLLYCDKLVFDVCFKSLLVELDCFRFFLKELSVFDLKFFAFFFQVLNLVFHHRYGAHVTFVVVVTFLFINVFLGRSIRYYIDLLRLR